MKLSEIAREVGVPVCMLTRKSIIISGLAEERKQKLLVELDKIRQDLDGYRRQEIENVTEEVTKIRDRGSI